MLRREVSQQHFSHRRRVRRQTRSHNKIDAHDALGLYARHVHHLGAVEDGGGTRLVQCVGDFLHHRLRDIRHVNRRELCEAEVEEARRERKIRAVLDEHSRVPGA